MSGRMTAREAKELSPEVWRYLAAHPETDSKRCLPDNLFSKIRRMDGNCPLCELYRGSICPKCPLKTCKTGSPYDKWFWGDENDRRAAAQKIVDAIEAWEPGKRKSLIR